MASSGRFVRNPSGYRAVLNGPELFDACDGAAAGGASTANAMAGAHGNYTHDTRAGRYRIHSRVMTPRGDYAAANSEAKHGVLRRVHIGL